MANTLYWVDILPYTCIKNVIVSLFKLDTVFVLKTCKIATFELNCSSYSFICKWSNIDKLDLYCIDTCM